MLELPYLAGALPWWVVAPMQAHEGTARPAAVDPLEITVLDLGLEMLKLPDAVRVTCELPGSMLTSRTVPMEPDDAGVLAVNEEFRVDVRDELALALHAALQSEDEEDSDIFLVVFGCGRAAAAEEATQEVEIGVAHVNLRACLGAAADEEDLTLELFDTANQIVGALSVTLSVARALRQLIEAQRPPLRPPPPLCDGTRDLEQAITLAVGDVQLWPDATRPPRSGDAFLAIELTACEPPDGQAESPSVVLAGGAAPFNTTLRLPLPHSGAARSALSAALARGPGDEASDLLLLLLLEGDRCERTPPA